MGLISAKEFRRLFRNMYFYYLDDVSRASSCRGVLPDQLNTSDEQEKHMKASEIDSGAYVSEKLAEQEEKDLFGANRPRLTLRMLHRLRKIRELQKLEAEQHQKFVARMYGGNFEESDEKAKDSRNPPNSVKPPKPYKPLEPSSKYLDKHTR